MKINKSKLKQAVMKAFARTYFRQIVINTPGRGIVRDGWDLDWEGDELVIKNEEFGDIILFLEEGTDPHIIRAKNKKFLRFKTPEKSSGKPSKKIPGNQAFEKDGYVFAKAVNHPGIEARWFIKESLNNPQNEKEYNRILEEEILLNVFE